MWPAAVEEVAAVFRAAGAEARLEELPEGEPSYPGPGVQAVALDCDGRLVVALLPHDRELDPRRLAAAAGCVTARTVDAPPFPYRNAARILIERILLGQPVVWIQAGSPRHVALLTPLQLADLLHAESADLLQER